MSPNPPSPPIRTEMASLFPFAFSALEVPVETAAPPGSVADIRGKFLGEAAGVPQPPLSTSTMLSPRLSIICLNAKDMEHPAQPLSLELPTTGSLPVGSL